MGHKIILSKAKLQSKQTHILNTLAHMAGDPLTREMLWMPPFIGSFSSSGVAKNKVNYYALLETALKMLSELLSETSSVKPREDDTVASEAAGIVHFQCDHIVLAAILRLLILCIENGNKYGMYVLFYQTDTILSLPTSGCYLPY